MGQALVKMWVKRSRVDVKSLLKNFCAELVPWKHALNGFPQDELRVLLELFFQCVCPEMADVSRMRAVDFLLTLTASQVLIGCVDDHYGISMLA